MTCLKNVFTGEVIRLTEAEAAALLASQLKVWLPCGRCEWKKVRNHHRDEL